jgi:hypothetical protein
MKTLPELLEEASRMLSERLTGGTHPHDHCDEDGGGNHRLDVEWWEQDAEDLIEQIREALHG